MHNFFQVVLLSLAWVIKFSLACSLYNAHSTIYLDWVNLVILSRNDCNNLNHFLDSDGFLGSVEICALSILTLNSIKRPRSVLRIFPTHTGAPDANRSIPPSKIEWIESMLPESFLTRKKRLWQLRFSKRQLWLVNLRYNVPGSLTYTKHINL